MKNYTAKYTKIKSGYMGQLVEWSEVITEGKTLEECRDLLRNALREMILAYRQRGKENPVGGTLVEQLLRCTSKANSPNQTLPGGKVP